MGKEKAKALGRGLGALIPAYDDIKNGSGEPIAEISLDSIAPSRNQPRKSFDQVKMAELAESIKTHGVLQPVLATREGDGYRLVAGERRYRAALMAGLETIPAILKDLTEKEIAEIALIENIQREDLNDIEEALAFCELRDNFNATNEEIAALTGRSRTSIANTVRLLLLPEAVQEMIIAKGITAGHGRAVLSLEDEGMREGFATYIAEKGLSVRQSEALSKSFGKKRIKKELIETHPSLSLYEEGLSRSFGTKVKIKQASKKGNGKIEIEYYSGEDLDRILSMLGRQ